MQRADQVKQQGATGLAEGQVAQFVEDYQVTVDESLGNPPGLAVLFLLF